MINRDQERRQLLEAQENPPAFVVMTGRRRVGKSYLLSETWRGERVVSFQGDDQEEQVQLELLAKEAQALLPGYPAFTFSDWTEALEFFGSQARQAPLTLVLDEFQWLCASQPALPSIIQRHWDVWQREKLPITLGLCGSTRSFMEGLLSSGAPLFGRADFRPVLTPLDYRWIKAFAHSKNSVELTRRYAILGGTPQYLEWAGSGSLNEVLRTKLLAKNASLYEEPMHLLFEESSIREPGSYFGVLWAIATGATQVGEIAQRSGLKPTNVSAKLEILRNLDYVVLEEPLEPHHKARGRSIYRIKDPFFRFWFRYVFPKRSRLDRRLVDEVLSEIMLDLDNYMGPAYEDVCRQWVSYYAPLDLGRSSHEIGRWWSRKHDHEIDIVAMSNSSYDLLASVKWTKRVDREVLQQLINDQHHLGPAARSARLAAFAREGFTSAAVALAEESNIELITCSDLWEG